MAVPSPDVMTVAPPAASAPDKLPPDCSVAFYGDSILAGVNLSGKLEVSPAETLRKMRPAYRVDDRAHGGDSATLQKGFFMNDTRTAKIIVIEYGVNDFNAGFPFYAPLADMVAYAKAEGRIPVLTGIMKGAIAPDGMEVPKRLAQDTATAYAGWDEVGGANLEDGHPTQERSDMLVAKLVTTLDKLLPECKP